MSRYAAAFTGLALMFTVGEAHAHVKLDVSNSTYQLGGLTREAIHEDMHRVAKKDSDGLIEGEVKDDWDWKFQFASANDACRVSSDEITLKLDVLLPTWKDEARADPALREVWNSYLQELKAHEDGHKAIAVDAAQRISKLVHNATASGPCSTLKDSLNRGAERILETAERAQEQLDANAKPFALE